MPTFPHSALSACIVGDDLHTVVVSVSPIGAKVRTAPTLERFLSMSADEARRRLEPVAAAGRVVLTCPASWCALRPIGLGVNQWPAARDDLLRSLDRLLPIPPDDAMIGLVQLHDSQGASAGGELVAIRRSTIEPWIDALTRALGRDVDQILTPQMAMLGLGLQREPSAAVIEGVGAGASAHRLAFGLPVAMDEPIDSLDSSIQAARATLPEDALDAANKAPQDEETESPGDLARGLSGRDVAAASALASVVAPRAFHPLRGRPPARWRRWTPTMLAATLAAALFITASPARQARLREATDQLRAEQSALTEQFEEARERRRRALQLRERLIQGVAEATASWDSVLPALAQIQTAMPEDGFLYRVEIHPERIAFSGEASNAPGILQRLEESPRLASAQRTSAITKSASGLDVFELRATRRDREHQP